ncbi:MAG: tripartite tricarboxylate transporter substrate-binding protein [Rectinemataceae bacterium]|nr:tripartite tricarboxylate transporter substrate-binding protein [Spirochaetaceae bacterium]
MTRFSKTIAAACLLLSCAGAAFAQKAPANYPNKPMEFVAPSGAGGGWDTTIRMVAKALADEKIVSVPMPVTNRTGGGGGINLAYMQTKKGADDLISVYSPPLLFIKLNGTSKFGYKDTTPLARLIADYGAFYVSKNSKYKTMKEVLDAIKANPGSVKIGGGSAAGSMDHIVFLYVAKAYGIKDLRKIQYIAFQDGTGPTQLMGGFIDVLSSDIASLRGLVESGDVRCLGITASQRIGTGIVATYPTMKEQGIDVEFSNWRGLFGPPEMPEYAVNYWRDALAKMVKTETWKKIMAEQSWTPAYMDQPEFKAFLDKVNEEYTEIFEEIGILVK